jgi:ubiquinone/menaquinone biosynthesis C-methylase UbiE
MKDNQSYYDEFSGWYDRGRDQGYHAFLDQSQLSLLAPYVSGSRVCEVGCGTGLLLKEVAPTAIDAMGIDISRQMLLQAHERHLDVVQGSATALPVPDESFDLVYSFKVLPHIEDIGLALEEVARVLVPGGRAFLEFYNSRSFRHLIKQLKPAHAVSEDTKDTEVYTRYDSPKRAASYLPDSLSLVRVHGIRVVTPTAIFHRVPIVRTVVQWSEHLSQSSFLGPRFCGFIILEVVRAERS